MPNTCILSAILQRLIYRCLQVIYLIWIIVRRILNDSGKHANPGRPGLLLQQECQRLQA